MMLATSKHVFKIKTCRNLFKNHDLLSAVLTFWFNCSSLCNMLRRVDIYPFLLLGIDYTRNREHMDVAEHMET